MKTVAGVVAILAIFIGLIVAVPPVLYAYGKWYCYWVYTPACTRPY